MIKNDILFTGYYGQLNTGDDAFVEVSDWGAKQIWKKNNISFLAVKKRLPKTLDNVKGYPLSIPKTYNFQQKILLNNTKYLISSGGSTFQNLILPGSLKYEAAELVKNRKLKIGAIGVSIGPFKDIKEETSNIEYLKRLSFLAVRDKRSYDYVNTLDLPYEPIEAFDLAALLPDIYQYDFSNLDKEMIIGVSVCNYERYTNGDIANEERRNKELINLLGSIDNQVRVTFKFFVINGNPHRGDLPLTQEIIQRVNFRNPVQIVNYNPNIRQVWEEIATCRFVLTTRLHAGIFACFANVPFMLVEYHRKCTDFLDDIGQPENYRINDAMFDLERVVTTICHSFEGKNTDLPVNRVEMVDKAYQNFKLITL